MGEFLEQREICFAFNGYLCKHGLGEDKGGTYR